MRGAPSEPHSVGVEQLLPAARALLDVAGVVAGLVEGVGEDMIPDSMDLKMLTDVVSIGDEESFAATRMLATREGLLVGGSCGLAFYGALQFLMRWEHRGGKPLRTVVLLPDSGSRYLTKVFNPTWLKGQDLKAHWAGQDMGGPVEYLPTAKKIEGV